MNLKNKTYRNILIIVGVLSVILIVRRNFNLYSGYYIKNIKIDEVKNPIGREIFYIYYKDFERTPGWGKDNDFNVESLKEGQYRLCIDLKWHYKFFFAFEYKKNILDASFEEFGNISDFALRRHTNSEKIDNPKKIFVDRFKEAFDENYGELYKSEPIPPLLLNWQFLFDLYYGNRFNNIEGTFDNAFRIQYLSYDFHN